MYKHVPLVVCYLNIMLAYSRNTCKANLYCCFRRNVSSRLKYMCTVLRIMRIMRIMRGCYYDYNVPWEHYNDKRAYVNDF
jgi:hypothetical protein